MKMTSSRLPMVVSAAAAAAAAVSVTVTVVSAAALTSSACQYNSRISVESRDLRRHTTTTYHPPISSASPSAISPRAPRHNFRLRFGTTTTTTSVTMVAPETATKARWATAIGPWQASRSLFRMITTIIPPPTPPPTTTTKTLLEACSSTTTQGYNKTSLTEVPPVRKGQGGCDENDSMGSGGEPIQDPSTDHNNQRSYNTAADRYFQNHGCFPQPRQMHIILSQIEDDQEEEEEEEEEDRYNSISNNANSSNQTDHENQNELLEDGDAGDGGSRHGRRRRRRQGILVVGDVHGCYQELLLLHDVAQQQYNQGRPFQYVIVVGDLCNKGPQSLAVIRHVRKTPRWLSVRGNHDDAALRVALVGAGPGGSDDPQHKTNSNHKKAKYQWIFGGRGSSQPNPYISPKNHIDSTSSLLQQGKENNEPTNHNDHGDILSDEDVQWMADLPYTISIPPSFFEKTRRNVVAAAAAATDDARSATTTRSTKDQDGNGEGGDDDDNTIVVVHAGLVPGVPLEQQTTRTMTVLRTVALSALSTDSLDGEETPPVTPPEQQWEPCDESNNKGGKFHSTTGSAGRPVPWASVWNGPYHVIFGHDARRGLQIYPKATGLDTGAVYGKCLTGLILPEKELVSVPSLAEHCPVSGGGGGGGDKE